jgi:hypothetical protein
MPSTHTWVQGGPILEKIGRNAIYASDQEVVWVWNEDTGIQVTDLRDANGNTISTVPIVNGRVDGVGVPNAVVLPSFSVGQYGPHYPLLPVQTLRNAAAALAPTDTQVSTLVNTGGSATRGALNSAFGAMPAADLKIYYVTASASASDSNTGRSWGNAFATVGAAVAALGANPGEIHVGPGVFYCNVLLRSNQSIIGSGAFLTTLKSANGANADVVKGYNYATLTGTNQNGSPSLTAGDNFVTLRDLTIDGNKANNTSGYGIRIWGRSNRFTNVIAQNCAQDGIRTEYASDINSFLPTNLIESHYDNVRTLSNGGNGWTDYGPHDSVMNQYEAFGNGGWGHLSGATCTGNPTLTISGATGGTFALFFNGNATSALAYNATAAQIQTALTALPGGSSITCTGGPIGTSAVTIANLPAGYLLDCNLNGLTGSYGGISSTLTRGTQITNGLVHGTQWNTFLNTNGVYVGSFIDVDGLIGDGSATNTGIGIFLAPSSGGASLRGNVASCTTGIIAGGSQHNIMLHISNVSGDGFVEAGLGLSLVNINGSVPTGGNAIKFGAQFAIPGASTTRARFSLTGTGTLTSGTQGPGLYDLLGSGNGNPQLLAFPGTSFTAVGWSPKYPQSNGVLLTKDASGTTVGVAGAAAALPAAPVAYWTVVDENGTHFKIPVYNV